MCCQSMCQIVEEGGGGGVVAEGGCVLVKTSNVYTTIAESSHRTLT